jgi:hypothetical protein
MRAVRVRAVCLAFALAVAAAPAAGAVNVPGTTILDKTYGYAITLPKTWQLVPRTPAALRSLIAALEARKSAEYHALAGTYRAILGSPSGVRGLSAYRLQAFAWPPDTATPLLTEVSLGIVTTSTVYGRAALAAAGTQYADALASNAGTRILEAKELELPAGRAELIEARVPAGGGLATGVELYLIPHGKRLYELFMSIDAHLLSQARIFTSIAQHFRFER